MIEAKILGYYGLGRNGRGGEEKRFLGNRDDVESFLLKGSLAMWSPELQACQHLPEATALALDEQNPEVAAAKWKGDLSEAIQSHRVGRRKLSWCIVSAGSSKRQLCSRRGAHYPERKEPHEESKF